MAYLIPIKKQLFLFYREFNSSCLNLKENT